MHAVDLLVQDHETVERLFAQFEELTERAEKGQQELAERITRELVTHAAIEEQLFYPAVRAALPDLDLDVREGLEEHHVAETLLAEIQSMDSTHERFRPKVLVLIEAVRHHVEEEEQELFPEVRKGMDEDLLLELGEEMEKAKAMAPTRPHPHSPDEPPANLLTDTGAALLDRLRGLMPG
jgi:hemerythrin superfamily protein